MSSDTNRIVSIPLALLVLATSSQAADSWTGADKAKHFSSTAAIAAAVTVATESERAGFWTAVAIGAAKEVTDGRRAGHTASWRDFGADVAGAYVGAKLGAYVVVRRNSVTITKSF